ncbi:hypothetical protein E2P81_ATG00062 [Venturia nashicola]|uniref:Gb n=1 Tax=Venturia nashicola TaxID=86259 RepID=A0A4Z1PVT8_9PEZI|nr:hypothetical protein E6O75_ATG00069 [Venturia nashicola]TLD39075.1 hypothetical protein E2P81_ATG00062 [Venturia nashicola]
MILTTFIVSVLPALTVAAPQVKYSKDGLSCADQSCSDPPPDGKVHIKDTQASGSGCPPSSVSIQISKDRSTVTIGMSGMSSYYGKGFSAKDNQHNCDIHTVLEYPGGYQFSVMSATYNGGARLDPGVSAMLESSYFFSSSPGSIKHTRTLISGPQYKKKPGNPFQKVDTMNDKTSVWSPCGSEGILNVNNILSVAADGEDEKLGLRGEVSAYDATVQFKQKVAVVWRRCGPAEKAEAKAAKQGGRGGKSPDGSRAEGWDVITTPTVYSTGMGDWRRPHAMSDFDTQLKNPVVDNGRTAEK